MDCSRAVVYPKVQYPARPLKTKTSRTPIPVPAVRLRASLRASATTIYGTTSPACSSPMAPTARLKTVQARLRHASAKTTLDTYGHIWPDRDELTRATVDAVLTAYLTEQRRNSATARP